MDTLMNFYNLLQARFFGPFKSGGEVVIVVHGGAGNTPDERIPAKLKGVKKAALEGYDVLRCGGTVVDAVEAAVKYLENDEHFNAGKGSVLNANGEVEMDASIMSGNCIEPGTVTVVKGIKNPVSLARRVLDKTPHIKLAGEGAHVFAKNEGIKIVDPGALVTGYAQELLELHKKGELSDCGKSDEPDTVGAVAVDCRGHVAAAASTGGCTGKLAGRCSSSTTASGVYADDNAGAVACTGHGESIIKFCLAHNIIQEMENGKTAEAATKQSLVKMHAKLKTRGGATAISTRGDVGIFFSTPKMVWAYVKGGRLHYGVKPGQHEIICFEKAK
ncbi:isoaspartyl peptidase/L-asparaginase-like [Agrilus planipennis]|uniref:Isoaspartyl peptidase/L-asparaginase-like n=1 Tax=Agrilus planipennis TaxID=224129 RepID=A0A1W4W563_AGRPL|nr:isoaspartyl peptidase/L-asparaginase-like [Agrilus planipennis]